MSSLVLHVGPPKTGSSSLQAFLMGNRHRLAAHGICFPEAACNPHGNHRKAADEIFYGESSPSLSKIRQEARRCGASRILLSSEAFYDLPPSAIKSRLSGAAKTTKIMLFARRQETLALSLYCQLVKQPSSRCATDFEAFVESSVARMPFSQSAALDGFRDEFGYENVIARALSEYHSEQDLCNSFIEALGIPPSKHRWAYTERRNTRPKGYVVRILARCNSWELSEGEHISVFTALTRYFENSPRSDTAICPPDYWSAQEQRCQRENEALAASVGVGGEALLLTAAKRSPPPVYDDGPAIQSYADAVLKTVAFERFHKRSGCLVDAIERSLQDVERN